MDYLATTLMTSTLWMPFFNLGLGLSPALLGGMLMLYRAWDAFCDPVAGNLSDNARTRWGRRRPFLFVGAIVTGALYPLFWHAPSSLGHTGLGIYLAVVGVVFFTAYAVWSMPYYGLQLELTPNYDERTRLTAWMTLFGKISSLGGSWLLALVILIGSVAIEKPEALDGVAAPFRSLLEGLQPWLHNFADPQPGEKPIVVGMRLLAWPLAACIVVFGILPALFVKERVYAAEAARQPKEKLGESVRQSLRCRPLWSLIAVSFFLVLGTASVSSLSQYVNFYYVCHGDLARASMIAGWKGTVIVVTGIGLLPVFTWLGERFDKRTMVFSMLTASICGHLLNFFLMTPEHPYLQIIPGVFEAATLASVWLFLPSMKADVADWEEERTGRRREGALNSFYSWFLKVALTCSMGLGGLVLQISGFDAALSEQPPEVLRRMFLLYLILPVVIWAAALVAACYYPLNRASAGTIRTELERRRGAV